MVSDVCGECVFFVVSVLFVARMLFVVSVLFGCVHVSAEMWQIMQKKETDVGTATETKIRSSSRRVS